MEELKPSVPVDDIIIARSNATLDEALLIPSYGTKEERLAAGLADHTRKQDKYFARVLKANEESLNGNYISMPEWVTSAEDFSIWVKGI